MASGGPPSRRQAMSEPRNRPPHYRTARNTDSEDIPLLRHEDRPNNWDFFGDRLYGSDQRRETKKANQDRQQKGQYEAERGQPISQDTPPQATDRHRFKTPSTFPIVSRASKAQRQAIDNVKQRMTFSDAEELSTDGERNNERYLPPRKKDRPYNSLQETSTERNVMGASARNALGTSRHSSESTSLNSARNTNLNTDKDGPDSNQIVGRLMQIRDYIKQTTSMMNRMEDSTDPKSKESHTKLASLVESLKEQEKGYLNLLQKVLAAREEDMFLRQNSTESANSKLGTDSEATSELEAQSNTSEDTQDNLDGDIEQPIQNNYMRSLRPMIEDRLGRHSDTDAEDQALLTSRSNRSPAISALDSTLIAEADENQNLMNMSDHKARLEVDLAGKNDELQALTQQMMQQQEQLKMLQQMQSSLVVLQKESEDKLDKEKVLKSEAETLVQSLTREHQSRAGLSPGSVANFPPGATAVADEDAGPAAMEYIEAAEKLPEELRQLRERLDQLKTIYGMQEQAGAEQEDDTPSEASVLSVEREQLQAKLQNLQDKKDQMDKLLDDLKLLRAQKLQAVAGMDGDDLSTTSSQGHILEAFRHTTSAGSTATKATDVLEMMGSLRHTTAPGPTAHSANDMLEMMETLRQASVPGATASNASDMMEMMESLRQASAPVPPTANNASDMMEMMESLRQTSSAGPTNNKSSDMLEMIDTRRKLQKLQEVKERLNQLKDLVQYYQASSINCQADGTAGTSTAATVGEQEDASSMPGYSEYDDTSPFNQLPREDRDDIQRDALSLLESNPGHWDNDPEIQEKVRRLNAAKEKLHRLRELVAMVENSPEALAALPDDLAELAARLEAAEGLVDIPLGPRDTDTQLGPCGTDREGASGTETSRNETGTDSSADPREEFYKAKLHEQQTELQELLKERNKILMLQSELQRLHQALPSTVHQSPEGLLGGGQPRDGLLGGGPGRDEQSPTGRDREPDKNCKVPQDTEVKSVSSQNQDTVSVTFGEPLETVISNEELYGQMRQQRILREELRKKKKVPTATLR